MGHQGGMPVAAVGSIAEDVRCCLASGRSEPGHQQQFSGTAFFNGLAYRERSRRNASFQFAGLSSTKPCRTWQLERICFLQSEAPRSLVGEEDLSDVRPGRPHPGAKQLIVRFLEPSADFPAHVHLY